MEERKKEVRGQRGTEPLAPAKKVRQSNMELLRLLSMLFVLILHADYQSIGIPSQADLAAHPLSTSLRVFFEHLAIVAVNVFVLISGWFGIRPKWEGLAKLLFQVLFLSVAVTVVFVILGHEVSAKDLIASFYPGARHWFVVAYVGLYVLSPLLNSFVGQATKRQFAMFLACFFLLELFYGYWADFGHFYGGYSMLHFMGIYLLARYARRYPETWAGRSGKFYFLLYVLTTLISTALYLPLLQAVELYYNYFISYLSPFVVLGSLFLFLAFTRFHLQSRFINWMAASCFAIYLIHYTPELKPHFIQFFHSLYVQFDGLAYLSLALLCLLCIGFACIVADQVRLFCWRLLLPILEKYAALLRRRFGEARQQSAS